MTNFTLIKKENGIETLRKSGYQTKEAAENAGNSWKKDCTVHAKIRENWTFEVI
jgi:uncharacterized protein YegP (UPF0339 family)